RRELQLGPCQARGENVARLHGMRSVHRHHQVDPPPLDRHLPLAELRPKKRGSGEEEAEGKENRAQGPQARRKSRDDPAPQLLGAGEPRSRPLLLRELPDRQRQGDACAGQVGPALRMGEAKLQTPEGKRQRREAHGNLLIQVAESRASRSRARMPGKRNHSKRSSNPASCRSSTNTVFSRVSSTSCRFPSSEARSVAR